MTLLHPWALLLLAAAPLPLLAARRAPRLDLPGAALVARAGPGLRARARHVPALLSTVALALLAIALAAPRGAARAAPLATEGIDVVVALDLSSSMRAADFQPRDRITVAREVLQEFLAARPQDRIGLVVFAAEAYTQAPLTLDRAALSALVARLDVGGIEDGTAIGDAIATAANRLRGSAARSRAVVLLTDGDDNASHVAPVDAARAAAAVGVKVFTILVGRGGRVPYPVPGVGWRELTLPVNPELLREVARAGGGAHWDAVDRDALLRGLHGVLDRLERTRLVAGAARAPREDLAPALLVAALACAAAGLLLGGTVLRTAP